MTGLIDSKASDITAHHPLYLKPITGQTPKLPQIQSSLVSRTDRLQKLDAGQTHTQKIRNTDK